MNLRGGSDAISPTAHYTGHVWGRHGLSHPELGTREGRILFEALAPSMRLRRALGGGTLESALVARHRLIDARLTTAIEDGSVSQVIEVACGMSPRGWRFGERYGDALAYVEADLPAMAARKRRALARIGSLSERHRVVELDALREEGPQSLAAVAAELDSRAGLAIVTEGLLTYLDKESVLALWARMARIAARFPGAVYLSDLRLRADNLGRSERAFYVLLSAFVRGRASVHFEDETEAVAALRSAGFADARLHRGDDHPEAGNLDAGAGLIRVLEARVADGRPGAS